MMDKEFKGYVIAHPKLPLDMCVHTFGLSITEAWNRHLGPPKTSGMGNASECLGLDRSVLRSRWAQKGYRPIPATLTIDPPEEQEAE